MEFPSNQEEYRSAPTTYQLRMVYLCIWLVYIHVRNETDRAKSTKCHLLLPLASGFVVYVRTDMSGTGTLRVQLHVGDARMRSAKKTPILGKNTQVESKRCLHFALQQPQAQVLLKCHTYHKLFIYNKHFELGIAKHNQYNPTNQVKRL